MFISDTSHPLRGGDDVRFANMAARVAAAARRFAVTEHLDPTRDHQVLLHVRELFLTAARDIEQPTSINTSAPSAQDSYALARITHSALSEPREPTAREIDQRRTNVAAEFREIARDLTKLLEPVAEQEPSETKKQRRLAAEQLRKVFSSVSKTALREVGRHGDSLGLSRTGTW